MKTIHILHAHGGRVTALTAIAHSTYKGRAEWHFEGTCEWDDGSHKREPDHKYDIPPFSLAYNGDRTELDVAIGRMSAYLEAHGSGWTRRFF